MKRHAIMVMVVGILAATAALPPTAAKSPPKKPPHPAAATPKINYEVVNEFKIGGTGRWSSITLDAAGKYLYVPRGTHTLVVDTATGKVAEIPTQSAISVALVPAANRGFITNCQKGTVTVFDLKTNAVLGSVAVGAQPYGIIYDPASKRLLVKCGDSSLVPFIPDIDLKTGKPEPAITFEGNIGGFVADDHGMVYVALTNEHEVAVLDTRTMTIATHWPIGSWQRPTAISMDRLHSRLFVRNEGKLTILSASDGHIIGDITIGGAASWEYVPNTAAYYDGRVFAACGDGTVAIVGQKPDGDFALEAKIKGEPNARSIAIDHDTGKIYLPTERVEKWQPVPETFKILGLQKK